MSLKVIKLAASVENSDEFHLARLLLLIKACSGKSNRPINGIMKLAKLDFLLRYPNCLVRVLNKLGREKLANKINGSERNTIEAKMIRFRFGPWDKRYRRWIGLLVAKGLTDTYLDGRTVKIKLTDEGLKVAEKFAALDEFKEINLRSKYIFTAVGNYSPTKLKEFVYEVFPEITEMKWGMDIKL